MVSFHCADGEIYWDVMRRSTEDGERSSAVFSAPHPLQKNPNKQKKHSSHPEYINTRAEERHVSNFSILWHDKAEADWRMLTNEGDATMLEE